MPRRREIPKRPMLPDPIYGSPMVTRFINTVMTRGKRSLAERVFYDAMQIIEKRSGEDPLKIFKKALDNVKPQVETKSRRVGGSTYQVPIEVNPQRRTALGVRWLVGYSRNRSERTMAERLANELMDAYNNRGGAIRKREDVHRMADANKAFAHYRW